MTTFGAQLTTDEVLAGVTLTGQRILVTGVSAGLGVETARALAAHGAQVVGAARDLAKAQKATTVVREQAAHGGGLELVELDLASLDSVRNCADSLLADGRPFDVIICNAGVMATPKGQTSDGFETQFGTNHLGHFVLVNKIASLLKSGGGRLVNLSSLGHRRSNVNLDDPNFETTPYTPFDAYGRSKTANILFAVEFDRRHRGRGVRATAVHPGGIQTELGRHMTPEIIQQLMADIQAAQARTGGAPFAYKTVPQGAATSVWAAIVAEADAVGGRYCEDCHVAHIEDNPERARRGDELCPGPGQRQGAVGEERGDGGRAVLGWRWGAARRAARHPDDRAGHGQGDGRRGGEAAQGEPAVGVGLGQGVAQGRAQGPGQDIGGPEQDRPGRPGEQVGGGHQGDEPGEDQGAGLKAQARGASREIAQRRPQGVGNQDGHPVERLVAAARHLVHRDMAAGQAPGDQDGDHGDEQRRGRLHVAQAQGAIQEIRCASCRPSWWPRRPASRSRRDTVWTGSGR